MVVCLRTITQVGRKVTCWRASRQADEMRRTESEREGRKLGRQRQDRKDKRDGQKTLVMVVKMMTMTATLATTD